jgi:hypothetical protein
MSQGLPLHQMPPHPQPDLHQMTKGRPARIPGLAPEIQPFIVPETIRKKVMRGWEEYIPLTYLTDRFCNPGSDQRMRNTEFEVNRQTGSIIPVEQPLNDTEEGRLSYEEWSQAWYRFLELLQMYQPHLYHIWKPHFDRICAAPNRSSGWQTWLAYDISLRRQSITKGIDPVVFHPGIWYHWDMEVAKRSLIRPPPTTSQPRHTSASHKQPYPNYSTHPFRPANSQIPADNQIRPHQTKWKSPRRCFRCGGPHPARGCDARVQVNGLPVVILPRDDGKSFGDTEGNRYCFAFNGTTGCTASDCSKGGHRCSLCKKQDHGAQSCSTV